jgi:Endonuclease-reverse transcriptase
VTFRNELVITGDFNIHVNATDWRSPRFAEILESFSLLQSVSEPTHWQRNTLDLVIMRFDGRPMTCSVNPPKVISDHALIVCEFPAVQFAVRQVYRSVRPWKKVDRDAFRKSLEASALCVDIEELRCKTVDELFDSYENTQAAH